MKRTGIMGGTFNPVHLAHLILAEQAYETFLLDEIVFLPSRRPAYKAEEQLLPDAQRYRLLMLAIEGNSHFRLSDMELRREGNTYTSDTIREWKRLEPDTSLFFIIGGDSLLTLEQWHEFEYVLANLTILATGRGSEKQDIFYAKASELNKKYHADIRMFETPAIELSSTEIRRRLSDGKSIRYLVPQEAEQYLLKHQCYRNKTFE